MQECNGQGYFIARIYFRQVLLGQSCCGFARIQLLYIHKQFEGGFIADQIEKTGTKVHVMPGACSISKRLQSLVDCYCTK